MSKKFDADAYVSRWDDKLIPIMLVVIVASMIGVYAMNVALRPACTTHDYVFCGTALGSYESEEGAAHGNQEHAEYGKDHAEQGNHPEPGDSHGANDSQEAPGNPH